MARFELHTRIEAPIELVFDLSRDIDFHTECFREHGEQAVAGRTSGLIELGESVTWKAKFLGLKVTHSSLISAFQRPVYFTDKMIKGHFRNFEHNHSFEEKDGAVLMHDYISFEAPLGILGWLASQLVLKSYLKGLLEHRNRMIKQKAEARAAESR